MKKILLAFDGNHFSENIFETLKEINKHQPVLAVGFFLPAVDYTELLYSFGGVPSGPIYIAEAMPGNPEIVEKNIIKFEQLCAEHGIQCAVHEDYTRPVMATIQEETRFADLLLIDGKTFYENSDKEVHHEYITNTLHKSECPVMVIPGRYSQPQSIIFTYDGSEQSVFAIKQFYYLFPFYSEIRVFLVNFSSAKTDLPQRDHIYELLQCYYKNITITKLNIHSKEEIEHWLESNNSPIFVTGSHGRSLFSEFIHHSFASTLIKNNNHFIFTAHK
ncbi:MAG: hypothetical protein JWQ38_3337 [Flavipsychrobacter sp.]|nr:hypothetical protein [Flavipsychrobacter sp.]